MQQPTSPFGPHLALLRTLGGSRADRIPADPVPLIGTLGPLPVHGHAGSAGETCRIGRAMARRGEIALLIGEDRGSGIRTVIATVTPPTSASMPAGDPSTLPLPLERLRNLPRATTRLGAGLAAAQALDVDTGGRRIVSQLARLLTGIAAMLGGDRHLATEWGLLQLTRLLFLRFVESEGWLDGRTDFLRIAFDDCLGRDRDPQRHLFDPLFFGTLNCTPSRRSRLARSFGAVPFLNGGLFSRHPVERLRKWHLDRPGWTALVDLVVDGIEVTLDERHDGRVTPDLLGRIFERMMDEERRHTTGTFYTPTALAENLVRDTVACHLAPIIGRSETGIWNGLEDPDRTLSAAVRRLRILDPACGSGVFLMAALRWQLGRDPGSGMITRQIVTRRLRGIDINPAAVRLTELRLWLEILRSMRGSPPGRIRPLPNLDTSIRAGDGLLDPLTDTGIPAGVQRTLMARHRTLTHLHGSSRRRELETLHREECRALATALEKRQAVLRNRLDEVGSAATGADLFGTTRVSSSPQSLADRKELAALEQRLADLKLAGGVASFSVATAFPADMRSGGFDLVIGNPPWVRAEKLAPQVRERLVRTYRWWRGTGGGWRHLPDLAVAFVERSHRLLREGGTLGMLLPAKVMSSGYGSLMREGLASEATIHRAARLTGNPDAAFDATTYPMALVSSRRKAARGHRIGLVIGAGTDRDSPLQEQWSRASTWRTSGSRRERLISSICSSLDTVGAQFRIGLGVKTGLNMAFLDPPETVARWTRPALRGRDARIGSAPRARILWTVAANGRPMPELPAPVALHLEPHREVLERRHDLNGGPWWRLFRTGPAMAAHRVVWGDLATRLETLVIEDETVVPLNSCYVAVAPSREHAARLALWCNSSPVRAIAMSMADPASGGYARFNARVVAALPVPSGLWNNPFFGALTPEALLDPAARIELDRASTTLLGISADDFRLLVGAADRG